MNVPAARRQQKIIDAVLLAAIPLSCVAWALGMWSHSVEYRNGFHEGLASGGTVAIFGGMFVMLAALAVWLAIVLSLMFAAATAAAIDYKPSAVRVGLVLTALVASPLACCTGVRGVSQFTYGFRDGLRARDIDYDAIRAWRSTYPATANEVIRGELPPVLADLRPQMVLIRPDESVELFFGGGFLHWSIEIYSLPVDGATLERGYLLVEPGVVCWSGE